MDYNPYAAPAAQPPLPGPADRRGQPQPWNTADVIKTAWARLTDNGAVLVGAFLLQTLVSGVVGQLPNVLKLAGVVPRGSSAFLMLAVMAASFPVSAFLQVGATRIWLAVARGDTPNIGMLFSGADRFLSLLGLQVLSALAIGGGVLLLVVPGVIVALGLFVAPFYVVDTNTGPIDAMKASWSATRGQKGEVFLLWLALIGLTIAGAAACCVGLLVAVPLTNVAIAVAYTRLSGSAGSSAPA